MGNSGDSGLPIVMGRKKNGVTAVAFEAVLKAPFLRDRREVES